MPASVCSCVAWKRKFSTLSLCSAVWNGSFSLRTKMWTDRWIRRKRKHSTAPPGIEPGSFDCRPDALTTKLRSHDRSCVRIFSSLTKASNQQSANPGSIPGGAAFFFFCLIQLSVHIFVGKEKESLIWSWWNGPDRNEFYDLERLCKHVICLMAADITMTYNLSYGRGYHDDK